MQGRGRRFDPVQLHIFFYLKWLFEIYGSNSMFERKGPRSVRLGVCFAGIVSLFFRAGILSAETAPRLSLDIELNGVKRTISEGDTVTIELPVPSKATTLNVRRSPEQSYEFNSIRFFYDQQLSIDDDREEDTRTVTLLDARGFSLVISDLGPPDETTIEHLTRVMTNELLKTFSKDPITESRTTEPTLHHAGKVSGMKGSIEYIDSDGDRNFSEVYVFRNSARDFSVTASFTSSSSVAARKAIDLVLRTITAGVSSV